MRRQAALELDKQQLIAIIQELEKRCQVVVNRQASAVLKDVPSWKQAMPTGEKLRSFKGGMRTWADRRKRLEKGARVQTDRLVRRTEEFKQVLSGTFGIQETEPQEESSNGNSTA